jgi:hypothetical protein
MHSAKPWIPEPSCFEAESAIENLEICKSPGIDQIAA